MPYVPPGVSIQSIASGIHEVTLTDLKQITDPAKLAKFSAQAVYVATWKSLESAIEVDQIIKFNGSKGDYYAGLTIDRMCMAAGLPEPIPGEALNVDTLKAELDGVTVLLEVNDKGYPNGIQVPMAATGTDEAPF